MGNLDWQEGDPTIGGWAYCEDDMSKPVEVVILADGKELCAGKAQLYRQDLQDLEMHPTGLCGFEFSSFDHSACEAALSIKAVIADSDHELNGSPHINSTKRKQLTTLVFIHIPKTAGTSFRQAMQKTIPGDRVLMDYGIEAKATSELVKETTHTNQKERLLTRMWDMKTEFFCGHFHASVYRHLFGNDARWCTFLRDPVERVLSAYSHALLVNAHKGSLEAFCRKPLEQNKQSRLLRGTAIEDFFFFGLTERYIESIKMLEELTGLCLPVLRTNVGTNANDAPPVDPSLVNLIRELNQADVALYERASDLFDGKVGSLARQ